MIVHRKDSLDPSSDGWGYLWILAIPVLIATAPIVFAQWLWAKRPWAAR